jgi:hypothetical protein
VNSAACGLIPSAVADIPVPLPGLCVCIHGPWYASSAVDRPVDTREHRTRSRRLRSVLGLSPSGTPALRRFGDRYCGEAAGSGHCSGTPASRMPSIVRAIPAG